MLAFTAAIASLKSWFILFWQSGLPSEVFISWFASRSITQTASVSCFIPSPSFPLRGLDLLPSFTIFVIFLRRLLDGILESNFRGVAFDNPIPNSLLVISLSFFLPPNLDSSPHLTHPFPLLSCPSARFLARYAAILSRSLARFTPSSILPGSPGRSVPATASPLSTKPTYFAPHMRHGLNGAQSPLTEVSLLVIPSTVDAISPQLDRSLLS